MDLASGSMVVPKAKKVLSAIDCLIFILFYFFVFSRVAPAAYGCSQARGLIGAVAASLRQGYSNAGSLTH